MTNNKIIITKTTKYFFLTKTTKANKTKHTNKKITKIKQNTKTQQ